MPPPSVPGFVTSGEALRSALAKNATLTERLMSYRDALGNAESKALIADALDELTFATWRQSTLLEALKLLVADVADYPAWQRPCHALDVAQRTIATVEGRRRA